MKKTMATGRLVKRGWLWIRDEDKKKRTGAKKYNSTKKETCYRHLIPFKTWLAHREGEEGMQKLGKKGLDKLEEFFLSRHRDVLDRTVMAGLDDVEQVGEQQLRRIIGMLESGPKIVEVENGDKIDLYVSLLALGPHAATGTIAAEKDQGRAVHSFFCTPFGLQIVGVQGKVPGLVFGPSLRPPNPVRMSRRAPDQRLKGKSQRNRERRKRKAKRVLRMKLLREANSLKQKKLKVSCR